MASPCTPRETMSRSAASTIKWTWSRCTEKCSTRKLSFDARDSARFAAANATRVRSDGKSLRRRKVTCKGKRAACFGLVTCGTDGRGPFLRPAPGRRPPQVRGAGNESCLSILIKAVFHKWVEKSRAESIILEGQMVEIPVQGSGDRAQRRR